MLTITNCQWSAFIAHPQTIRNGGNIQLICSLSLDSVLRFIMRIVTESAEPSPHVGVEQYPQHKRLVGGKCGTSSCNVSSHTPRRREM